jgi:crossover junction endodeoxyribonuclease RusA
MSEHTIRLPWQTPPLSLNDRSHWRSKAAKTAEVRNTVKLLVRGVKPAGRVAILLTYVPRDRRRRDRTNLVATYKACVDGCVDAGVIPDDTPEFLDELMPEIGTPDGDPRLELTIRRLA